MAINTNYYSYLYTNNSANSSSKNYGKYNISSLYDLLPNNTDTMRYSAISNINNVNNIGKNVTKRISETVQNFISNAKVEAFDLKGALDKLLGANKQGVSSFTNKTAESSNKDIVAVKSVDSLKSKNADALSVKINQLAVSQENRGGSLAAKESATDTGFSLGSNSVKLTVGSKSYVAEFSVATGDTNRDVQQKIANSINGKNAGVTASVAYNAEDDTSSLVLESTAMGTDKDGELKFSLNSLSGNAVELTGIGTVSRHAQNAQYSINGGAVKTSKVNDIDIGNGITVSLKSEGTAEIKTLKDASSAISDIKDMISKYNNLLSTAETNRNDSRTNALYRQLSDTAKYYASSLSRVGIEVTSSGYLKVNEAKLKSSAENGNLETFVTGDKGRNYGFANRLSSIADKVDKNTTNYATITYESTNELYNMNQYQIARYSSYQNTGLMLSMFV